MSGSGGTCFGLFADEAAATHAAGAIAHDHPGWWVHPTHLVHEGETKDVWLPLAERDRGAQGGRRTVSSQWAFTTSATETMSSKAEGLTM